MHSDKKGLSKIILSIGALLTAALIMFLMYTTYSPILGGPLKNHYESEQSFLKLYDTIRIVDQSGPDFFLNSEFLGVEDLGCTKLNDFRVHTNFKIFFKYDNDQSFSGSGVLEFWKREAGGNILEEESRIELHPSKRILTIKEIPGTGITFVRNNLDEFNQLNTDESSNRLSINDNYEGSVTIEELCVCNTPTNEASPEGNIWIFPNCLWWA